MKYIFNISLANFTRIIRDKKIRLYYIYVFILIILSTAILAFQVTDKTYDYSLGDIIESDIRVPRDIHFVKESETELDKKRAVDSVSLVFDKDSAVLEENLRQSDFLLNNIIKTLEDNPPIGTDDLTFQLVSLKNRIPKYAQYDDSILLSLLKYENPRMLKKSVTNILIYLYDYKGIGILDKPYENVLELDTTNITVRNINSPEFHDEVSGVIDNLVTIDTMKGRVYSICASIAPYFPRDTLSAVSTIIKSNMKPNLSFNSEETKRRLDEKIKQVKPVTGLLKKGQTIGREGDTVTNDVINKIKILNQYAQTSHVSFVFGVILLQLIFVFILSFFSFRYEKHFFPDKKAIYVVFSLIFFYMIYAFFISRLESSDNLRLYFVFLMPLPFVTMMVSILYNVFLSLFSGLYLIFFTLMMVGVDLYTALIVFSTALIGTFINSNVGRRSDFFKGGLILGVIVAVLIFAIVMIENSSFKMAFYLSQLALANGIINSIMVLGIFPLYEHVFDITTRFKLMELSDLNADIFKKMLLNAPGTYNHSLLVATLAESASIEIDANHMLARVGGYYHDIGKISDPGMYIENTITDSRAKRLPPADYSRLIISHVSKGVELAREYSLPESVIDFIREHHGNSIMTFFYHQALENASTDGVDKVDRSDFQYPGPKPHSKETAIVMLADAVEAASRSLKHPSRDRIKGMVTKIIYNKLNDGDLDNSELSMKELKVVENSFLNILYGIFHTRIEYPDAEDVKDLEKEIEKEVIEDKGETLQ